MKIRRVVKPHVFKRWKYMFGTACALLIASALNEKGLNKITETFFNEGQTDLSEYGIFV